MSITEEISGYISEHKQEAYDLLIELARIPAPSGREERRAKYIKEWLEAKGAKGVYIDDALNVVYPAGCADPAECADPAGCAGENPVCVFSAHTDVVFPDETELPVAVREGMLYAPGIGDDTANVAALMIAAGYLAEHAGEKAGREGTGCLIVFNSGEEGLGNLKGIRAICRRYGSRIRQHISFDGTMNGIVTRSVGSKRYRVEVRTEGGHSYGSFGNRNAIAYLASLIGTLYELKVPTRGRTTYNVGTISGGTSVNTIAQQAWMLYEFRSDDREDLEFMERHFEAVIEAYRAKGITVQVDLIGERPCMGEVPQEKMEALIQRVNAVIQKYSGRPAGQGSGSTDCNIPHSLGIPAVSFGAYRGGGSHTRGEWLEIESLEPGLKIVLETVLTESGWYQA